MELTKIPVTNMSTNADETFLRDADRTEYLRCAGGLTWPSGKHGGAIVLILETKKPDDILGKSRLYAFHMFQVWQFGRPDLTCCNGPP